MESTGLGGKVHVSEETADLIRQSGQTRWLIKRNEKISAKGKGQLQTYWAEPHRESNRVSFSEKLAKFSLGRNSSAESAVWDHLRDESTHSSGNFLNLSNFSQWAEQENVEEDKEEEYKFSR